MKNKLIGIMSAFAIMGSVILNSIISINAQTVDETFTDNVIDESRKVSVNIDDNFYSNQVLVYFKHQYSELNKKWNSNDFDINGITDIKDLTYIDKSPKECKEYLSKVTFRQIIKLTLSENNKKNVCDVIEKLSSMEEVLMATPNYYSYLENEINTDVIPDYTSYSTVNNYAFDKLQLHNAQSYTSGSSTVKVGIMDSGIDNNSHLSNNLGVGYNFSDNNYNTSDNDSDSHGTKVASVIGGDITGICTNVTLIPLKIVSDVTHHTDRDVKISAISYANSHNIPILNMSYCGNTLNNYYDGMDIEISNYYGLFINSSGDYQTNVDDPSSSLQYYPVVFDCANMLVVASSDRDDSISFFSAYGPISVDLCAPGMEVPVICIGGTCTTDSGTSLAAPYVAGTAALLLSYNSNLTTAQLKYAILNSVDYISDMEGLILTSGRLNVYKALQYVTPTNKYRNYILRTTVPATFNYSSVLFSLDYMTDLYELYDVIPGNLLTSNSHIGQAVQMENWWNQHHMISINNITTGLGGDIAKIRLKSRFLKDSDFISNGITFNSNRSGVAKKYILLGDINFDGEINNSDSLLLSRALSGTYTLSSNAKISADTNQNGVVDSNDLNKLNNYINNTLNSFF